MKKAKIEIWKWASVFSLVYVITKPGKKIILTWVKILMGGNRLENLQFLGFFGDFGIISYSAQNHGLGPKICKYVL